MNAQVHAMTTVANSLYAGETFVSAGGMQAHHVARWNGHGWSALGSGLSRGIFDASVYAMVGSGGDLYVGGFFSAAGGNPATNVAKWDGNQCAPAGLGLNEVFALAFAGTNLYAASTSSGEMGPINDIFR